MRFWMQYLLGSGLIVGIPLIATVCIALAAPRGLAVLLAVLVLIGALTVVAGSALRWHRFYTYTDIITAQPDMRLATERSWFPSLVRRFGGAIVTSDELLFTYSGMRLMLLWQGPPIADHPIVVDGRTYAVYGGSSSPNRKWVFPCALRLGPVHPEDVPALIREMQRRANRVRSHG